MKTSYSSHIPTAGYWPLSVSHRLLVNVMQSRGIPVWRKHKFSWLDWKCRHFTPSAHIWHCLTSRQVTCVCVVTGNSLTPCALRLLVHCSYRCIAVTGAQQLPVHCSYRCTAVTGALAKYASHGKVALAFQFQWVEWKLLNSCYRFCVLNECCCTFCAQSKFLFSEAKRPALGLTQSPIQWESEALTLNMPW